MFPAFPLAGSQRGLRKLRVLLIPWCDLCGQLEDFKGFLVHRPQKLKAAMAECAVQGLGLSIHSCTSVLTQSNNLINHLPLHHCLTSRDARHWRQRSAVALVPLGLGNALTTLVM